LGMDFAPSLSVKLGYPIRDRLRRCARGQRKTEGRAADLQREALLQGGFSGGTGLPDHHRSGAFPRRKRGITREKIVRMPVPADLPQAMKQFVAFEDAGAGAVDITQAELLVSIGRGSGSRQGAHCQRTGDKMKGVLSCSRRWWTRTGCPSSTRSAPREIREAQSVPCFRISGAFQHVAGITGAGCVIAVNKDKKARFSGSGLRRGGRSL